MDFDDLGCLNHYQTIEVILHAGDIPLGSTVRKVTGTRTFTLVDRIKLYEDGDCRELTVDPSCRILMSRNGNTHNVIGNQKKLVWIADSDDLMGCLGETPQ